MEDPIKTIRTLIADVTTPYLLDDETLLTYLQLYSSQEEASRVDVFRAAADALEAIAVSETLVGKKIRTQDLSTDGPAVSDSLRKTAAVFRKRADDEDAANGGIFEIYDSAGYSSAEGVELKYGSLF